MFRITSVKSSIGIITHQGHISKVNANVHSVTLITSRASCDAKKTRLLCLRRIVLIYLCEAADMRNVFAQINENIESVNCRYFSVAQCATLQTTLQKGILSTKEISSFVDG